MMTVDTRSIVVIAILLSLPLIVHARPGDDRARPADSTDDPIRPSQATVRVDAGADGFQLRSDDGDFALRFGGLLQSDGRFLASESGAADRFFLRRVRPTTQATFFGMFDARFVLEFGGGGAGLQDAFLNARLAPSLQIQTGKFKQPVGLEYLQSGANLTFIPRAAPTGAVPNRDVGLMVHGTVLDDRLDYQVGVFNGTPDGQSRDGDDSDGKDVAGRLFLRPLSSPDTPTLGIGVGGSVGQEDGPAGADLPTYTTRLGREAFFRYNAQVAADGARWRLAPQAYLFGGPFGLIGEFVATQQAVEQSTEAEFVHRAWNVTGAYVLTGEEATFGRVRPDAPFDGEDEWGAVELTARVHGTSIDDDVFDQQFASATTNASSTVAWGAGVNWHLNRNVRFVLNYEQTHFTSYADAPARDPEQAIGVRFQVAF